MEMNPLKQLYTDFLLILNKCVVKYKSVGDSQENLAIKKEADAFVIASQMKDNFETYYHYDKKIISEVLNTVEDDKIQYYYDHRSEIPLRHRDMMVEKQRAKIISEYEEKNNYYRMLNGLPDYESGVLEYIYIDDDITTKYNIPKDTPIHMLDDISISVLSSIGYIDKLVEKYPQKEYLKYLGSNKIDIVTARLGKNFSLLKMPMGISDALRDSFLFIYEQCREYFMSCIYIPEYRQTVGMYDNFIALCIMVMTLQQIFARVIKTTIERNFFDDYCVQTLFSVYNLPYYKEMDSSTRQQIVQNLNILVQNKGTNKVLFDIASILGYDRLKIFKYYLMKVQKFSENGIPVVEYKTDSVTGESVYDYEKMFDIYFQKVNIDDLDTYKTLIDKTKKASYQEITGDDPFWVDDAELNKELYESEYNFVETKYMGVSISYKLTRLLFENIYLLRIILDKKDEIPGVTISLPKISMYDTIPLFDAIVVLCAMTCKQNGLKGEILVKPSMILHVMGFNFEKDFLAIQKEILDDPYLDDSLVEFFKDSTSYTIDGINRLYKNMLNLYDVLVEGMCEAKSIEAYDAYKKLYYTMFYENENEAIFNIGTAENPVYAKTFKEYIQHTQPEIYDLIESTEPGQLHMYINHICSKIKMMIPDLKYLGIFSDTSETMEAMLVNLIRFFKSYTTDMIGLNILYIYDMKPELLLRFIEDIHIHKDIAPSDTLNLSYAESVEYTANVEYHNRFRLFSAIGIIHVFYTLFDFEYLFDKIESIRVNMTVNDQGFSMYDVVSSLISDINLQCHLFLKDLAKIHNTLHLESIILFEELCKLMIRMVINDGLSLYDLMLIKKEMECDNNLFLRSMIQSFIRLNLGEILNFSEFLDMAIHERVITSFTLISVAEFITKLSGEDVLQLLEFYELSSNLCHGENLSFSQLLSVIIHEELINKLPMVDIIHILKSFDRKDMIAIADSYKEYSTIYSSDKLTYYQYIACTLLTVLYDSLSLKSKVSIAVNNDYETRMKFYDAVHNHMRIFSCSEVKLRPTIQSIHSLEMMYHDNPLIDLISAETASLSVSNGLNLRETYKISYV